MPMRSIVKSLTVLPVALALAGCGAEEGPRREAISGTVKLDGKPIEKGLITLTPSDGGELVVSGLIVDGEFSLPRAEGPGLGPHRVDIWSKQPTGRVRPNPDDPDNPIEEKKEIVPPQFNLRSRLSAEVAEGGANTFDFDLTTSKVALKARP